MGGIRPGLGGTPGELHARVHRGGYRAKPSKRIYLQSRRQAAPDRIAALEDKIVQQAVVWVLEQIYEEVFLGFSYGFRPGRSAHDALDAVWVGHHAAQGELGSRRGHPELFGDLFILHSLSWKVMKKGWLGV